MIHKLPSTATKFFISSVDGHKTLEIASANCFLLLRTSVMEGAGTSTEEQKALFADGKGEVNVDIRHESHKVPVTRRRSYSVASTQPSVETVVVKAKRAAHSLWTLLHAQVRWFFSEKEMKVCSILTKFFDLHENDRSSELYLYRQVSTFRLSRGEDAPLAHQNLLSFDWFPLSFRLQRL